MPIVALTHLPSPRMNDCVRTHAAFEAIDLEIAALQHASYRQALERAGATVRVLDDNRDHPDAVFIEDSAVVLDEIAVITSMGAPSRRLEPRGIEPALAPYRTQTKWIDVAGATLEGGDVVCFGRHRRTILVGLTARTNAAGAASLEAIARPYGYDVVALPVSRDCLHLKSACTALPDGALLVNRAWLEPAAIDVLARHAIDLVDVAANEPHAANVVVVGRQIVMAAAFLATAERIANHASVIHRVELTEFAKADGCATCLSLVFDVT